MRITLVLLLLSISEVHPFAPRKGHGIPTLLHAGFEETGSTSKGLVASLTSLVNTMMGKEAKNVVVPPTPSSRDELFTRIQSDYNEKNYLWTGDIDLGCFDEQCRFTDPTLSFEGRDQFVRNLANLRPLVDALVSDGRSDLLEASLEKDYVQTRWNMVGTLGLPWKPRVDVIGRTKFWYNDQNQVYFYDEEWEIPASQALWQLLRPGDN